jgi:DNA polymerase I-like protein with 3'-5' exonuclease and polymerase domains
VFLSIDFNQSEVRTIANLSKDRHLVNLLNSNVDVIEHSKNLLISSVPHSVNWRNSSRLIGGCIQLSLSPERCSKPLFIPSSGNAVQMQSLVAKLTFASGVATLSQKAACEGINLSSTEASMWIAKINQLFPDIAKFIHQVGGQVRSTGAMASITGKVLDPPELKQDASIWNAIIRASAHDLVRV